MSVHRDVFFCDEVEEGGWNKAVSSLLDDKIPDDCMLDQDTVALILDKISSHKLDLNNYVSIDKVVDKILHGQEGIAVILEDEMAEEFGVPVAPRPESISFNTFEKEVYLVYGIIKSFGSTFASSGFGATYCKFQLTDLLSTKEITTLWSYFTTLSIAMVFGQIECEVEKYRNEEFAEKSK